MRPRGIGLGLMGVGAVLAIAGTGERALAREAQEQAAEEMPFPGYIPFPDRDAPEATHSLEGEEGAAVFYTAGEEVLLQDATLPSRFVTQDMPDLRNQGSEGACWAFSSLALAELSLRRQGYFSPAVAEDLSELHLSYFMYHSVEDPLGGTAGDDNRTANGYDFLSLGGNLYLSQNVLAAWVGAADEALAPYEEAESARTQGLDDSLAYLDAAHLTGYYEVNIREQPEVAKRLIMQNGGVGIGYASRSSCYNGTYNSYYNPNDTKANHAVTIVGWDDGFSRDHFSRRPEADGAWLVRNSWMTGEGSYSEGATANHRYNGYFWMSYEEASLEEAAFSFSFAPADAYDHNYQYDGNAYPGEATASGTLRAANVFTAKKDQWQSVRAVAFYTGEADVDYTVAVYAGLSDGTDPESGTLRATVSGRTSCPGYYTVELPRPVLVTEGTEFSVVVTLGVDSGGSVSIGAEGEYVNQYYNLRASAAPGQSFLYQGGWQDYGAQKGANLRIKAFTKADVNLDYLLYLDATADGRDGTLERGGFDLLEAGAGDLEVSDLCPDFDTSTGFLQGMMEGDALTLEGDEFLRPGYTLTGWRNESTGKLISRSTVLRDVTRARETVRLTAQWKRDTYRVAYSLNGGSYASGAARGPSSYTVESGRIELPSEGAVRRAGYAFDGWYESADFAGEPLRYVGGDVLRSTKLYAKWSPIACNLILDAGGGTAGTVLDGTAVELAYGATYALSGDLFVRPGYRLASFNTAADGSGKRYGVSARWKNQASGGGSVTLYAQWSPCVWKIRYDLRGGKQSGAPASYRTDRGAALKTPVRQGFTFAGWKLLDAEGAAHPTATLTEAGIAPGSYGDVALLAEWEGDSRSISYTVAIKPGARDAVWVSEHIAAASQWEYRVQGGDSGASVGVLWERPGYRFAGYNTRGNGKGIPLELAGDGTYGLDGLAARDGARRTYYAVWEPLRFALSYQWDEEADAAFGPLEYVYGKALTLKTPKALGHTFLGWTLEARPAGASVTEREATVRGRSIFRVTMIRKDNLADLALRANFLENRYRIRLSSNGGVNRASGRGETLLLAEDVAYAQDVTALLQEQEGRFSRKGFVLAGFASDAKGKRMLTGQIRGLSAKQGATVTVYAIWERVSNARPVLEARSAGTVAWERAGAADESYELEYAPSITFRGGETVSGEVLAGGSYVLPAPSGRYYVRLRAKRMDSQGNITVTPWSAAVGVTVP